jgi:indolepyruvate decarboxylase
VQSQDKFISNVYLGDVLKKLIKNLKPKHYTTTYQRPKFKDQKISNKPLTLSAFYLQLIGFLKNNDILVVETGSSSINMPKLPLPDGVKYHNQTLWGSIGWATPAALGTALASPRQRTILVTGEGSHQLTLNELGVMGRYHIAPILFCINNNGFMIERGLELDPTPSYDDLAQLNYAQLPAAFGCSDWLTFKVQTEQELADALVAALQHKSGVYIELITGKLDYGSSLAFYNQHLKQLYN